MRARIGAYARISFDGEGEALGVARQRSDTSKLADLRQWEIVQQYTDNNLSAFKTNVYRPEFERMLEDLEKGVIDGVIAYDLDRVARQPVDLERIIRLYEKRPGLVFATVQGDIDLSTPDGLTMARVLVAFANKASMDTSRRIKRKNIERAENGLPHGSRRPYGYAADHMTIDPIEGPILHQMGMRLIGGESYRELAYWMNESSQFTTTGKQWFPITIRNTLRRPRYAAIRVHNGIEYPGIWQPVFSRDEWDAIQYTMKRRREDAGNKPVAKKYLLTGFLVCGKCAHFLNGETKRDAKSKPLRRVYVCRVHGDAQREGGCGGVTRSADALEHFIRELICFRLDTDELSSLLDSKDEVAASMKELLAERESLSLKKNSLVDDYADGTLDKTDYTRAQARVDSRLAGVDAQLDQIRRSRMNVTLNAGETVKQAWMTRPDGWKRELISTLIESIVVTPGISKPYYYIDGKRARFDPELVDVNWKI